MRQFRKTLRSLLLKPSKSDVIAHFASQRLGEVQTNSAVAYGTHLALNGPRKKEFGGGAPRRNTALFERKSRAFVSQNL